MKLLSNVARKTQRQRRMHDRPAVTLSTLRTLTRGIFCWESRIVEPSCWEALRDEAVCFFGIDRVI